MYGLRRNFGFYFISVCIFLFGFVFISLMEVHAYDFPANSNYISGNVAGLGDVSIYFPIDKAKFLTFEGNRIINVGSSSVTGYFVRSGTDYTVSCPVYQSCRYRLSSSSSYVDIVFTGDVESNINFVSEYDVRADTSKLILLTVFGGVLLIWVLYMSKSKR